jgi:hypothetical protein
MGFEKLMLIFCWDAVSMFYSIHAYPCPALSRLSFSLEVFGSVKTEYHLRIDTSAYEYRKSVIAMQKKK